MTIKLKHSYVEQFFYFSFYTTFIGSLPVTYDSPFPDISTVSVDANEVLKLLNELDIYL